MDPLSGFGQPVCPSDDIVLRDHPKGYECPECGFLVDESAAYEAVVMPPEFDGPDFHDRRR